MAVLLALFGCLPAFAFQRLGSNELLTNGSAEDTQKAINAATDGTIIKLPDGKYTWYREVTNSKKTAIHLIATNAGRTIIKRSVTQRDMIFLNASPNGNAEISGIHFEDPYADSETNYSFCLDVNQTSGLPVLIHDCSFVSSSKQGFNYLVRFIGNGGVLWNCSFAAKNDMLGGISFVNTTSNCSVWNQPDSMGAGQDSTGLNQGDPTGSLDTYIENCVFQDMDLACTNFDDNSRAVVRYCTVNNATLNSHGQETSIWGTRHWEIYNNTFNYSTSGRAYGGDSYPLNMNGWFGIRGGTGVITNNAMDDLPFHKLGILLTIYSIDRRDSIPCQTAYPAAHQTGQGWSAASTAQYGHPALSKDGTGAVPDPIYIWNNTGTETTDPGYVGVYQFTPDECGNHEKIDTFLQEGRDYFVNEARPGWTPYTYPHPLRRNAVGPSGSAPLALAPK
ncbi:MAG: hypothetical protein JOZ31_21260 [Verrucomicrobia bacterium]|nr:hypothetical protein [Verrucomicrobiota bacterium]